MNCENTVRIGTSIDDLNVHEFDGLRGETPTFLARLEVLKRSDLAIFCANL